MWRPGSGGDPGPFPLRAVGMLEGEPSEVMVGERSMGRPGSRRDHEEDEDRRAGLFFSQANIGPTVDGLPSVGPSGGRRWFSRGRTRGSGRAVGLPRKLLGSARRSCRVGLDCKNRWVHVETIRRSAIF
jgi:hypothetical protein